MREKKENIGLDIGMTLIKIKLTQCEVIIDENIFYYESMYFWKSERQVWISVYEVLSSFTLRTFSLANR